MWSTTRRRHRRAGASIGVAAITIAALTATAGADAPADHGSTVAETPRADVPEVLDGVVKANVEFGDLIVVAGEFTQVRDPGGAIVNVANMVAYDSDTGAVDQAFDPRFDGEILAMDVSHDETSLFVGGLFSDVDGAERHKIVKLDSSGDVVADFVADTNAKVQALVDDSERLYIGGNFSTVNGEPRVHLAAVDADTGAVDEFKNDLSGPVGLGGSGAVRALDIHPDRTRLLVAHSSTHVAGLPRTGVAQIDLTTDAPSDWHTTWYANAHPRCADGGALTIRDAEYSPDGTFFAVVEKGHFRCDKTIAFRTGDWPGDDQPMWVTQMFDSSYSVGVSDAAVYVGGHFCFVNPLGRILTHEVATYPFVDKPEPCEGGGNPDQDGVFGRYQIAALDPLTGNVLPWNPTTNALEAVFDIEVIDRGILIGQDREQIGGVTAGRHAWLEAEPETLGEGYFLLGEDGTVFTFGDAVHRGDADLDPGIRAVAIDATPSGDGYIIAASDWTIHAFGDAPDLEPNLVDVPFGEPPVAIQIDPMGAGYWAFTEAGRVVAVGDLPHLGDVSHLALAEPVIAATLNAVGDGYRLLGKDGGVFSFGTDAFLGSVPQVLPGVTLDCPIVGLVGSGLDGYWLVGCDGGVFAFGDAPFVGSLPALGVTPDEPVNAMVPYGHGYLLIAADGGVFAFGGPFLGSLGDDDIDTPITAIATV